MDARCVSEPLRLTKIRSSVRTSVRGKMVGRLMLIPQMEVACATMSPYRSQLLGPPRFSPLSGHMEQSGPLVFVSALPTDCGKADAVTARDGGVRARDGKLSAWEVTGDSVVVAC